MRLVLAVLLVGLAGCQKLPTGPASRFDPPVRSVTLADWTADGYVQPAAVAALDAIAATGANRVTFIVTVYQATRTSSQLRTDDPRTPTVAAVSAAIASARTRGLNVAIKLHVDVDDGAWRGSIDPQDRAAWFSEYAAFVEGWAGVAETEGAQSLVFGTELATLTATAGSQWRSVIGVARASFPGTLAYAASWDEAQRVTFWDALDNVGVDAYFPVTERDDAGRLDMLVGWSAWLERLHRLHRQTGKRIMLTEIGYRSVDGAGRAPFEFTGGGTLDLREQADLYWAALEATGDKSWIEGLDWWNWRADGTGGSSDTGYTPEGKPAHAELSGTWGGS